MKKMRFYFLIVLASIVFAVQTTAQTVTSDSTALQHDSIQTTLNLSADVVNKLNSNQLVELIKHQQTLVHEKELALAKLDSPALSSNFIGTLLSILLIVFILSLYAVPYYFNSKKEKGRQQIILNLIEKDKDIPLELLAKPKKVVRSDLHKGIQWTMLGLSLCLVVFILKSGHNYWTIGLIPLFIGIGYLILSKLNASSQPKSEIE